MAKAKTEYYIPKSTNTAKDISIIRDNDKRVVENAKSVMDLKKNNINNEFKLKADVSERMKQYFRPLRCVLVVEMVQSENTVRHNGDLIDLDTGNINGSSLIQLDPESLAYLRNKDQLLAQYAKVIKICDGAFHPDDWPVDPGVKPGDYIVIAQYGGYRMNDHKKNASNIRLINSVDMLCVVDPKFFEE